MQHPRRSILGLFGLGLLAACATPATSPKTIAPPTTLEAVGMLSAAIPFPTIPFPKGFLAPGDLPDSAALLPPPPADGSAAKAADEEAFQTAMAAPAERKALAASDADLSSWAHIIGSFEPIVGLSLSDGSKPNVEMLLRRAITDGAMATYGAKNRYRRARPFMEHNSGTCSPKDEPALRKDGSYPSGHTAIGWMLALVLTDLFPDKQVPLFQRGYDFGQSRVVCGVHWMSDTVSGRTIAAITYARLQSDPVFSAQRDLARKEVAIAKPNQPSSGHAPAIPGSASQAQ